MPGKYIHCCQGDITESDADAIVNAANNHLWMGSGVAGAIKRKGGPAIEIEAMSKGPIDVGDAVATGAGNLAVKYVIHAAAMGQDLRADNDKIRRATQNALLRAEELKLRSLDFSALGAGVGGFAPEQAAQTMVAVAREFLKGSAHVTRVGFVLFDSNTFSCFKKEIGGEEKEI